MIRPQISNAVIVSVLFASLAGGAALLTIGGPAVHRAAAKEASPRCVEGQALPARMN